MGQIYEINDVRKGNKLNVDNQPFVVVSVDFRKPGKGTPSTVVRMKNMISGAVLERTYKSGEKLDGADIEERTMTFSYAEGEHLVFMDSETFEQLHVDVKALEENRGFLLDNATCQVLLYNGQAIGVTLPTFVEMDVMETEPGFKGDTANNVLKPATVNTGAIVQVPIFINVGDRIRIDTRTGEYADRVGKSR